MHWERTKGREGIEPIPRETDEALLAIRIGDTLGVPAPAVPSLPGYWITHALLKMRIEAMQHERATKRAQRARKSAPAPRSRHR